MLGCDILCRCWSFKIGRKADPGPWTSKQVSRWSASVSVHRCWVTSEMASVSKYSTSSFTCCVAARGISLNLHPLLVVCNSTWPGLTCWAGSLLSEFGLEGFRDSFRVVVSRTWIQVFITSALNLRSTASVSKYSRSLGVGWSILNWSGFIWGLSTWFGAGECGFLFYNRDSLGSCPGPCYGQYSYIIENFSRIQNRDLRFAGIQNHETFD